MAYLWLIYLLKMVIFHSYVNVYQRVRCFQIGGGKVHQKRNVTCPKWRDMPEDVMLVQSQYSQIPRTPGMIDHL